MTGHLDPNSDNDYVYRMPDLLLNGCNLSDTLVFLPKLSTKTLRFLFRGLLYEHLQLLEKDDLRYEQIIDWHLVHVRSIIEGRKYNE